MNHPPLGVTTRALCLKVVDGDTIDVEVRYPLRIRLEDCWSPERNTPAGRQAKRDLEKHVLNKPVVLYIPTGQAHSLQDVLTLDRVIGSVWLDGDSISDWQVRRGNASTAKGKELGT